MAYFTCTVGGSNGSYIEVTCDLAFAGVTITCTNGINTYTKTCPSSSPYKVKFSGLDDGIWTISGIIGGVTNSVSVTIDTTVDLHQIPVGSTVTPVNDIQTWLNCGNVWDKAYTTLNEVLADPSTLQTLIASNNAADYMARSTSWASSVTANATAMTYIGANNYCSDALLADNTWGTAICDSVYVESVLNAKVPTMTSNTTPSGVAFGSNNTNAFKAFDGISGDTSNYWAPIQGSANSYIGYMFSEPIAVKQVYLSLVTYGYSSSSLTGIIEASNDGSNYTSLGNITLSGLNTGNVYRTPSGKATLLNNTTPYLYYRIRFSSVIYTSGGNYALIGEVKFQGREDI